MESSTTRISGLVAVEQFARISPIIFVDDWAPKFQGSIGVLAKMGESGPTSRLFARVSAEYLYSHTIHTSS